MAKYLFQANYAVEGVKGLLKEGGSSRRTAVAKTIVLMTPDEVDAAVKKTPSYRAPGQ